MTFKEIEAELRRIVALYPDAIYVNDKTGFCLYTEGHVIKGPPECGCLFAHVFRKFNIDMSQFEEYQEEHDLRFAEGIENVLTRLGVCRGEWTDPMVFGWCTTIQNAQDEGETWSKALDKGDELYPVDQIPG